MIKRCFFTLLIVMFGVISLMAQTPDSTKMKKVKDKEIYEKEGDGNFEKVDGDLYEMDLSALLNMEVSTVSKKAQNINEAPAIIEAYTAEQIEEMGFENLYELLGSIAGIEIMETYYGYTDVQFRGILQSHYNNKANLLLNGQPLFDQVVSCYYLEQIPMASIQRIEIIRGPGGVLYGTNAYAGVINIVTKTADDIKDGENGSVTIKYGSFNTKNIRISAAKKVDDFSFSFASEFNDSDGFNKQVDWDEDDVHPDSALIGSSFGSRTMGYYPDDPDAYENDYFNTVSSMSYKDITLNMNYFHNQKDKFGLIPTLVSTGERTLEGFGANLKYDKELNEKMLISALVWYDQISKEERVNKYAPVIRAPGNPEAQDYEGKKMGFQGEYAFSNDKLSILSGIGFEQANSEPYYWYYADSLEQLVDNIATNAYTEKKHTNDIWVFSQGTYKLNKKINAMLGARYNVNQEAGGIYIPNAGLVFLPTEKLSFKLLYGMGYRNPSFFEKYVRTVNVLAGDVNLETETVNNFDFGIDYSFDKYSIRLNAFYMITANEIVRIGLDSLSMVDLNNEEGFGSGAMVWSKGSKYVNNIDGNTYQGVEFSFQGYPHKMFSFRGNLSYKQGKSNTDNSEITEFAPITANLSLTFKPYKGLFFNTSLQYIGNREIHYKPTYPWQKWTEDDFTIDAYTLLNASIGYKFQNGLKLSVIGKNLTDTEYFYPEYIRKGIPYIPGGPGRAMYVELKYRF